MKLKSCFYSPPGKKEEHFFFQIFSEFVYTLSLLFKNTSTGVDYVRKVAKYSGIRTVDKNDMTSSHMRISCLITFLFCPSFTTVVVDTRLWKTKHSRKRFQNSFSLTRYRHIGSKSTNHSSLAWRRESQKVTPVAVIGGFRSDLSITRMTDGNFGNVSASVLFSNVAYQRKRW